MNIAASRDYPRTLSLAGSPVKIGLMSAADGPALHELIKTLPSHDLLFVNRDISHPKVIAAWLDALGEGGITSLTAYQDGKMVGCTGIVCDPLSWSPHIGELRVLVAPQWRGVGLGRALIEESFAQALGLKLEKLTVQMTVDQGAAIAIFEELGFRPEAVLRNQVKDRDGRLYDLAQLSLQVCEVKMSMRARGMADALSGSRED